MANSPREDRMRTSRFSAEQIVGILNEHAAGTGNSRHWSAPDGTSNALRLAYVDDHPAHHTLSVALTLSIP
jgi:hypothetical protein